MKVAVVSDDGSTIAAHFGRAQGFIVFTVENNQIISTDWLSNTFTGHMQGHTHGEEQGHGHGMHGHGLILRALADCEVIVSRGMGRRAYDDLTQGGRRVVITDVQSAGEAVNMLLAGNLENQPQSVCCHGHEHGQANGHGHDADHDCNCQ